MTNNHSDIDDDERNSMNFNKITSKGAIVLYDRLRMTESTLSCISISYIDSINDDCMQSLGEYLFANKSIEDIYLNRTSISNRGIEILVPFINNSSSIKRLYIAENKKVNDKSLPLLLSMIESSHIEECDIIATSITKKNIIIPSLLRNLIINGSIRWYLWQTCSLIDSIMINVCEIMKMNGIDKLKEIEYVYGII